ncbi:MAG TPA: SRPBCC family protein [Pseudonocardia sp.]|nr:SRPBCC family protein [Pseudonocardia sp.]
MTERTGTLTIEGDQATLTFVRHLPYPIEAVWAALADPRLRADWMGETTLDGRVGGRIEMMPADPPALPDRKRMTGAILVWDPPKVLEHEWHQDIVGTGVVRYELAEQGSGTVLTFTHRGLSVRNARGFLPGTHAYLDRLAALLAGAPLPNWSERYQEVAPEYPSWR